MGNIKAVIFDLDGTLIDTERLYRINWPKAMAHFGYEMTDEQALAIRSLGRPYAPVQFKEWFGEDFDYFEVREYRKQLMREDLAKEGIKLKPGAVEILEYLRDNGIVTAMATANGKDRTERYLAELGLRDHFDKVICADMVEHGKPAPDIYAYACQQLGFEPSECMAVEDSPNGVTSAYKAGCKVVYVPDQSPLDDTVAPMLYSCQETLFGIKELVY